MHIGKLLQRAALSGFLVATGVPAEAQDIADDKIRLYASDKTLSAVKNIVKNMLDLSKADIVLYSSRDLIQPHEEHTTRILGALGVPPAMTLEPWQKAQRMRNVLAPFEHILPYTLHSPDTEPKPGEFRRSKIADELLFVRFIMATSNSAAALAQHDPETQRTVCEITAPDLDGTPASLFRLLSHLPAYVPVRGIDHIQYEDIIAFVMFHEAAHCAQSKGNYTDLLGRNLITLTKEIDADEKAIRQLRSYLGNKRDEKYIQDIVEYTQAARSIGALRAGGNFFAISSNFPTHATHVFGPEEKVGFSYDASDIATAAILLPSGLNLVVGATLGIQVAYAEKMKAQYMPGKKPNEFGIPLTPQEFIVAGQKITRDKPEIEFGVYKELANLIRSSTPDHLSALQGEKIFVIMDRMIENYTSAIERYTPDIAAGSLTKDVRALIQESAQQISKQPFSVGQQTGVNPDLSPLNNAKDFLLWLQKIEGDLSKARSLPAKPPKAVPTP